MNVLRNAAPILLSLLLLAGVVVGMGWNVSSQGFSTVNVDGQQMTFVFDTPIGGSVTEELQRLPLAPASPYRWISLAEAFQHSKQSDKAEYCLRRAVELGRFIPPVLVRAVILSLERGDHVQALRVMKGLLQVSPDYADGVLSSALAFGVKVTEVLDQGLPEANRPAVSLLTLAAGSQSPAEVTLVWDWLRAKRLQDAPATIAYVNYLFQSKKEQQAARVWAEWNHREVADYLNPNRVFDGGFEQVAQRVPLGWSIPETTEAETVRDCEVAHSGRCSMKIHFLGSNNIAYRDLKQVVVLPDGGGSGFTVEAFLKAQELTTDQGVYLRARSTEGSRPLEVRSETLTGSSDWRRFKLVIPATSLRTIVVEVLRDQSMKFDNKIAGNVWIDDVRLTAGP